MKGMSKRELLSGNTACTSGENRSQTLMASCTEDIQASGVG